MPKSPPPPPPPPKRVRLTLGQLASYDDLLTDALVDNAYYWNKIRKNRDKYTPCRRFNKDEIRNILFDEVICARDVKRAEERLLQLPGINTFVSRLKTEVEREHFKAHMRKYISIWQTDCPWEVNTTNRYTILTYEAAAFARRRIVKGEVIKYLCGTLVLMTPEEEKEFDLKRKDFSIVRSSRRKASALFLGPARFSNHDCEANAALSTRGKDGMVVIATRNIELGDEITVNYSDDYFGIDNCECLCHTCERHLRNGWGPKAVANLPADAEAGNEGIPAVADSRATYITPNKRSIPSPAGEERHRSSSADAYLSRKRQKMSTTPPPGSRETSGNDHLRVPALPSRAVMPPGQGFDRDQQVISAFDRINTALANPVSCQETKPLLDKFETDRAFAKWSDKSFEDTQINLPILNGSNTGISKQRATSVGSVKSEEVDLLFDPNEKSAYTSPDSPPSLHSEAMSKQDSSEHGLIGSFTAPEMDTLQSTKNTALEANIVRKERNTSEVPISGGTSGATDQSAPTVPALIIPVAPTIETLPPVADVGGISKAMNELDVFQNDSPSDSELSELGSDEELDDTRLTVRKRGMKTRSKALVRETSRGRSTPQIVPSIETPHFGRRPGDYHLTKELLANPGSMWVSCHTCDTKWVQENAHETRRECPRCERHSIMYGYVWPQTEQEEEGPERVRDHRTVNRILCRDDQKGIRRRGKGLFPSPSVSVSRTETPVLKETSVLKKATPPVKRPRGRPPGKRSVAVVKRPVTVGKRPVGRPPGKRPIGRPSGKRPVGRPPGKRPVGRPPGKRPTMRQYSRSVWEVPLSTAKL